MALSTFLELAELGHVQPTCFAFSFLLALVAAARGARG